MPTSDQFSAVGVAGLCRAGRALALRLAADGLRVSLWDASFAELEEFVTANMAARGGLVGYANADDFFASLNTPRRIAVFEREPRSLTVSLRSRLQETDRLLEAPWDDPAFDAADASVLELTLTAQLF